MSRVLRCAFRAAAVLSALSFAAPCFATIYRVPTQFTSFRNAVVAAADGDTVQVVGNGGATFHASDVHLDKNLTIQGGWRADFRVRDPSTYVTVLRDTTNANDKPILRVIGAPHVVLDGVCIWGGLPGLLSPNGANLEILNCTVRGQRNFDPSGDIDANRGTGLRISGGTVLMENCRVTDIITQFGGAGLSVKGATSFILRDSQLDACLTGRYIDGRDASGGAIFVRDVPDMQVENSQMFACQTLQTGALGYLQNTTVTMTDCTFHDGQASTNGGGFYLQGCPSVVFDHCTFQRNIANTLGGALACQGGSLTLRDCSLSANQVGRAAAHGLGAALWLSGVTLALERTTFASNHFESPFTSLIAEQGGAVYAVSSSGTADQTTFTDEKSVGKGGSWFQVGGDVLFTQCRFDNSRSNVYGGTFAIELGGTITLDHCLVAGSFSKFGGAFSASFTGNYVLRHCTVTGASARSAGAAFYVDTGGTVRLLDSIACCSPAGEVVYCAGGAVAADHSDVWNDDTVNIRVEWGGACPDPTGANGNLRVDPQFCTADADFRLAPGSPCAGTASDGSDRGWRPVGCSLQQPTSVEPSSWGRLKSLWR